MDLKLTIFTIISFLIFFIITFASYKLQLVDKPNNRKIHLGPTAFTGGISLSLVYLLAIMLFDFHLKELNHIITIGFLVALVGFVDDIKNLNTGGKLSLQIIPIFYLIIFENIYLIDIGDYKYFSAALGSFSIPFTLLSVLFLINSFNYSDGLDGTLGLIAISTLFFLFFLTENSNTKLFLIVLIIPLVIFLFFNFSLFNFQKLFLGDSGSLILGFIISFLLILFANEKYAHPIILAWSVALIVYEFLSVNLIRIKNKQNPFNAGKDHLHHLMLNKYKSIYLTNLIIVSLNLTLFLIGYISFKFVSPIFSLINFIIFFIIFIYFRLNILNKK